MSVSYWLVLVLFVLGTPVCHVVAPYFVCYFLWGTHEHMHFQNTVKSVFKGHFDQGIPCDTGTVSQNEVLSSPCQGTCDKGTPHDLSCRDISL